MEELKHFVQALATHDGEIPEQDPDDVIEYLYSSLDLMFEIIQEDADLRWPTLIFLKRILDIKLKWDIIANDEWYSKMKNFVLDILVPLVPHDPAISAVAGEIFGDFLSKFKYNSSDTLQICESIDSDEYNEFLVVFLLRFNPVPQEMTDFSVQLIGRCLCSEDSDLVIRTVQLLLSFIEYYPEHMETYSEYLEHVSTIIEQVNSPEFWNALISLPNDFSEPFIAPSFAVIEDEEQNIDLRMAAFFFTIVHFTGDHLSVLEQLFQYLVEFQSWCLQSDDAPDISLYSLFQVALEDEEYRSDVFDVLYDGTSALVESDDLLSGVVGLYNMAYMIDNASDLSYEIFTDGLDFLVPFLQSEEAVAIEAVCELMQILIGKPMANTIDFEPIFEHILALFVDGDMHIRNRCSILCYKFLKSRFLDSSWAFGKFVEIVDSVKETELSLYLELLAMSLLKYRQTVADDQIDTMLHTISEVLESSRDLDVKVPAGYLWSVIMTHDFEIAFEGMPEVVFPVLCQGLGEPVPIVKRTACRAMLLFMKATNGTFNRIVGKVVPFLYKLCSEEHLPMNYEPQLLSAFIRYDESLLRLTDFSQRLTLTITYSTDIKQFNIAAKALKPILWMMDGETQVAVAEILCSSIVPDKTLKHRIRLLLSILKDRSPEEIRVAIAECVCGAFEQLDLDSISMTIGSYCVLAAAVVTILESETPSTIMEFCEFLADKATTNPLHYARHAFYLFATCCRHEVVDAGILESLVDNAFEVIQETKANLDLCAALVFLKAVLELSLDYLSDERMAALVQVWEQIKGDERYQASLDYLSYIFLYIGSRADVDSELVVASLANFPPRKERCLTPDMCSLLGEYFANLDSIPDEAKQACVTCIIRYLSAGKLIRYWHKTGPDYVSPMLELCLTLMQSLDIDLLIVAEVFPDSPRKQAVVTQFLQAFIEKQSDQ